VLAQFVLIVFAMFAVLSLVIDVGYARLTQSQMQNAADTAALEGLRTRGDTAGRLAAHDLVQRVFDDDLDPTNGDSDYQFGAGPIIDLTDGATNLHALETMSVPDTHVYKPDLQPNQDNAPYGDMVSGSFTYNSNPGSSEDAGYARNDFNPGVGTGAFLVRLRRSNEFREAEPGVASSGSSLPLVFGRGTTIFGDDPTGAYSVRRDGLTVRATAIAQVRPALHVGLPQLQANPPLPGVTPFAMVDACVQNAAGTPVIIAVTINPTTGVITRTSAGPVTCPAGTAVGRFVTNPSAISTVGQPLPAAAAVACVTVASVAGWYGPVYSAIAGTNRIIGFAGTSVTRNACPAVAGAAFTATISRGASAVAASNATANLIDGLPLPANVQPAAVAALLQLNAAVTYGPVLVPGLAR
jgi:hypothetical protein